MTSFIGVIDGILSTSVAMIGYWRESPPNAGIPTPIVAATKGAVDE
jgi:hypothetical protein